MAKPRNPIATPGGGNTGGPPVRPMPGPPGMVASPGGGNSGGPPVRPVGPVAYPGGSKNGPVIKPGPVSAPPHVDGGVDHSASFAENPAVIKAAIVAAGHGGGITDMPPAAPRQRRPI